MKLINFTEFFFYIFHFLTVKFLIFYGKHSKIKFVKLIYLISRVFLAWTFENYIYGPIFSQ